MTAPFAFKSLSRWATLPNLVLFMPHKIPYSSYSIDLQSHEGAMCFIQQRLLPLGFRNSVHFCCHLKQMLNKCTWQKLCWTVCKMLTCCLLGEQCSSQTGKSTVFLRPFLENESILGISVKIVDLIFALINSLVHTYACHGNVPILFICVKN